jgi:hypothetical protein
VEVRPAAYSSARRDSLIADAALHIGEPVARIDIVERGGGDQGVAGCSTLATSLRCREEPSLGADGDAARSMFGDVGGQIDPAFVEGAVEAVPAVIRLYSLAEGKRSPMPLAYMNTNLTGFFWPPDTLSAA